MPKDLLGRLLMDLAGDALGTSAHGVSPKQMRRQLKRLRKGKISPLVALGGAGALVALGGALAQGGTPSSSMTRGTAPQGPAAGGSSTGGPANGGLPGLPLPTAPRSAPPPLPPLPVAPPPPAPHSAAPSPPPVPQSFASPPPLPPEAGSAPPVAAIPAQPQEPPPVPAVPTTVAAPQPLGTPPTAAPAPNAPTVDRRAAEAPPVEQAPEASSHNLPQASPQSSPEAAPQSFPQVIPLDRAVTIATPPPIPLPVEKPTPPPWDEDLAHRLLYPLVRTLIAAALCDGHLSPAERESLIGHLEGSGLNDAQVHQVRRDLSMPATRHELADLLQETLSLEDQERSGEAKELLYRAALAAILIDQRRDPAEDRWLAGFARTLELPEVRRQRADSSPSDLSQLLPVLDT
ncbi:MAG: DUF533 domain-containing protein [Acidobacteriota bacterium]